MRCEAVWALSNCTASATPVQYQMLVKKGIIEALGSVISEIKNKSGLVGYKVEPWLKTTREDMFIVNMDNVITMSESSDMEMIVMYQHFLRDSQRDLQNQHKLNRRMGYLSNVNDAKENLEKIFKLDSPENTSS